MSSSAATSASHTTWERRSIRFRLGRRQIIYVVIGVLVLISAAAVFYVKFWPFSREAVLQDLREASDSTVTAQSYHPTFFPPGCVLYGLEFHHGPNHFKLIEIQKLRVRGSYFGMLRGHVPRIIADGAHVFIPAFGTKESFNTQHSTTVSTNSWPMAASLSSSPNKLTNCRFVLTSMKPHSAAYAGAVLSLIT